MILDDPELTSNKKELLLKDINDQITTYIDGPFGAPAENYQNYENLIFIASGGGITPFSSIVTNLLYKLKKGEKIKHKTISFYWIQRDYSKTDYLNNILEKIAQEDKEKLFQINIFITCAQQNMILGNDYQVFFNMYLDLFSLLKE